MTDTSPNTPSHGAPERAPASNRPIVIACVALVAAMLGLSYAAVPLYELFCRVTGYGGTTQRADAAPGAMTGKTISIRFDATVKDGFGWHFKPVVRTMDVTLGEQSLAFYEARNDSDRPLVGTASFNVTPEIAGSYFSKIECFCFTEQRLEPGQRVDMPVSFFVDPEMLNDPDARAIPQITLSYTFFPLDDAEESKDTAAARGGEAPRG